MPLVGAQIDRFECARDRNHDRANDRERPEHIDIGEQIHLMLQRLATACDAASDALDPCAWKKRFMASDGLLIADIARSYVLDQAALMELLALRQNGLCERHPNRPT